MCDIVWVSRRNTDWSLKVSISSYRHRSDLVWCGNSSEETIVVEEEQSPVVGLWGHLRGVHWPPRPTSRILSIDCWCQLVPTHAAKAFGMSGEMVVDMRRVADVPGCTHLRSADSSSLAIPATRRSTIGNRALVVADASVWDKLPQEIRSVSLLPVFRRRLQTRLFDCV